MGQELKFKYMEIKPGMYIYKENLLNETVKGTGIGGPNGPIGGMIGGGSTGGLEIWNVANYI